MSLRSLNVPDSCDTMCSLTPLWASVLRAQSLCHQELDFGITSSFQCAPVSILKPLAHICSAICPLRCLHSIFRSSSTSVSCQRSATGQAYLREIQQAGVGGMGRGLGVGGGRVAGFGCLGLGFCFVGFFSLELIRILSGNAALDIWLTPAFLLHWPCCQWSSSWGATPKL